MARKRTTRSTAINEDDLWLANAHAEIEGPKRKTWSLRDLKDIKPLTPNQQEMMMSFFSGNNIIAVGSAGTGKTFLAIYLALNEVLNPKTDVNKVIVVRSAVPAREIGFTPGTLEEKAAIYELPYTDVFRELVGRPSTYRDMKDAGLVEFQTTSFLRGVTWSNAIVVVDECQNMTFEEINTIMTRLGTNSRIIVVGDAVQSDLNKKRETMGIGKMMQVALNVKKFSTIEFTRYDIVRSDFVKSWIVACEDVMV